MINTEIKPFKATAFKNGDFVEITEQDVKGKWLYSSFTQQTSLSYAQLS